MLELVELRELSQQRHDAFDGPGRQLRVATGALHEPHEDGAFTLDERRHAPHVVILGRGRVFGPDALERLPAVDPCEHLAGVHAHGGEDAADLLGVLKVLALVVPQCEQRQVGIEEAVG